MFAAVYLPVLVADITRGVTVPNRQRWRFFDGAFPALALAVTDGVALVVFGLAFGKARFAVSFRPSFQCRFRVG